MNESLFTTMTKAPRVVSLQRATPKGAREGALVLSIEKYKEGHMQLILPRHEAIVLFAPQVNNERHKRRRVPQSRQDHHPDAGKIVLGPGRVGVLLLGSRDGGHPQKSAFHRFPGCAEFHGGAHVRAGKREPAAECSGSPKEREPPVPKQQPSMILT